jgi:hypothetical protein
LAVLGVVNYCVLARDDLVGQEYLAVGVSADVDWPLVEMEFVNGALTLFYYEAH